MVTGIATQFANLDDELPDSAYGMTPDEFQDLVGELYEAAEDLERGADRAAVALDELEAVRDG